MQEGYNRFNNLSDFPFNIIKYLVDNNENIWKILKYPTSDCLSKNNLTELEKLSLIWNGDEHSENYNVFMDSFSGDDVLPTQMSLLRVFPVTIDPKNRVYSQVDIAIECICHYKVNMLDTYQPRSLRMIEEVLSTLNGININGIGLLSFENNNTIRSNIARYDIYNDKNYKGYTAKMTTRVG